MFYLTISELKTLAENDPQSNENIFKIVSLLHSDQMVEKYFFTVLQPDHSWVPLLFKAGFFQKTPEPQLVDNSSIKSPKWWAGDFLEKYADKYPGIIEQIIPSIVTSNSFVIEKIIDISIIAKQSVIRKNANHIINLINNCGYKEFLPISIGKLILFLLEKKDYKTALLFYHCLYSPTIPKTIQEEKKSLLPRIYSNFGSNYWTFEEWGKINKKFIDLCPFEFLSENENLLNNSINIILSFYPSSYDANPRYSFWRSSIEPSDQNLDRFDLREIYIESICKSLLNLAAIKPLKIKKILDNYINHWHSIYRRIGLFLLSVVENDFPDLLETLFLDMSFYLDKSVFHEYYLLLKSRFSNLSEKSKKEFFNKIFSRIEKIENSEEFKKGLFYERRKLDPIKEFIPKKYIKKYSLSEIQIPTDMRMDFTSWHSDAGFVSPGLPIETEKFELMTLEKKIEYLINFSPSEEGIFEDQEQGLGELLKSSFIENTSSYLANLDQLENKRIKEIFHYYILNGLIEKSKSKEITIDKKIIEYLKFVCFFDEIENNQQESTELLKSQVAEFLLESFKNNIDFKEIQLEQSSIEIIDRLLNYSKNLNTEISENDPLLTSLNSYAGKSMFSIMEFIRYKNRKLKEINDQEYKKMIPTIIYPIIDKYLDLNNRNLSIRSVYGHYLSVLFFYDKKWLSDNLVRIFPKDSQLFNFFLAAWQGYITTNRVYADLFPEMVDYYQFVLNNMSQIKLEKSLSPNITEKIIDHLLIAYTNDLLELDSLLIKSLFESVTDDQLSFIGFWCKNVLEKIDPKIEKKIWSKIFDLWSSRIEKFTQTNKKRKLKKEISNYLRILPVINAEYLDMDLIEMIEISVKAIDKNSPYPTNLIFDFVHNHFDRYPAKLSKILLNAVEKSEDYYVIEDEKMKEIFIKSSTLGDSDTKRNLNLLINLLGERGDFRWETNLSRTLS